MGKIWFITGAGRGIGAEIARSALNAGDRVVATGRRIEQLQAIYGVYGERVQCLPLDVGDAGQAAEAVQAAMDRFGRIDVLVNNAGYGQLGIFEEVTADDVERQFRTNVFGLMHVSRAVLPVMRKQRSGRVINLASIGGFMGFKASAVYCAAKFAVEGFSESLALEVEPFGIRVTIVEPGFFRTDFLDVSSVRQGSVRISDYDDTDEARADYADYNRKQPGDPAKLGRVIVLLASMPHPPLHFVAGSDAVRYATATFERRHLEILAHANLSVTTDLDEVRGGS